MRKITGFKQNDDLIYGSLDRAINLMHSSIGSGAGSASLSSAHNHMNSVLFFDPELPSYTCDVLSCTSAMGPPAPICFLSNKSKDGALASPFYLSVCRSQVKRQLERLNWNEVPCPDCVSPKVLKSKFSYPHGRKRGQGVGAEIP